MVYRINQTVIFNPDDGTLTLVEESHQDCVGEISLTPTASRLLHHLITHQGSVLQREELLERVWDNYGLKSSNNSLNQYISMLRRNFADLGLEEIVIVTVPRIGFMFSQELNVVAEQGQSLPIKPVDKSPPGEDAPPDAPAPAAASSTAKRRKGLFILLAMLTLANLGYAIYRAAIPDSARYEARYRIGELHGCPVYSFYRASTDSQRAILEKVEQKMEQADFACPAGSEIYYRAQETLDDASAPLPFVAVCYSLANNLYAKCNNSYDN